MGAKILSIDGGGIKGIIPASILKYIETGVRAVKGNSYYINQSFDLIGGTSTGGILAVGMLCPDANGKAKFSVDDLLKLYVDNGHLIFAANLLRRVEEFGGVTGPKYSAANIEMLLKQYFGDAKLSQLLKDCLITSYNVYDRSATFFSSDDPKNGKGCDYFVRDIARSTSAAPTYFPTENLNEPGTTIIHPQIDGGVFANNPAMCALVELSKLSCQRRDDYELHLHDITMISIGTGTHKQNVKRFTYDQTKGWGDVQWVQPLIDIMMSASADTIDYQLEHLYQYTGNTNNYIRIQPDLTHSSPNMDDASPANIAALQADANDYITNNKTTLDNIVQLLSKD